jgi:hypothetical protein
MRGITGGRHRVFLAQGGPPPDPAAVESGGLQATPRRGTVCARTVHSARPTPGGQVVFLGPKNTAYPVANPPPGDPAFTLRLRDPSVHFDVRAFRAAAGQRLDTF